MDKDIASLIAMWPAPEQTTFANDIGVSPPHVAMMKKRNAIHVRHWPKVVDAARKRGLSGVDFKLLVSLHVGDAA
jgi:hypothetical protein